MQRFGVIAALLLLGLPAQAETDAKQALIERLFQVTHMSEVMRESADAMFATMRMPDQAPACYKEAEPELINTVRQATDFERTKPFLTQMYTDVFSEEELQQMIRFYSSPVGQKTLEKMPILQQKALQHSQSVLRGLMPRIHQTIATYCKDD
tara:strand:+ start:279 stop:734 length:456 start_codon:yes stop_codon:yes gene_type:complete